MIEIRRMTPADIPQVARVYVEGWKAGYRGLVADGYLDALESESWAGVYQASAEAGEPLDTLVLLVDGALCGVSKWSACRDVDLPEGTGEVVSLYLLPGLWGRGLGARLLWEMLLELASLGFRQAILWTLRDNHRAQRAYVRAGFVPDGTSKELSIGGETVTAVRFGRALPVG